MRPWGSLALRAKKLGEAVEWDCDRAAVDGYVHFCRDSNPRYRLQDSEEVNMPIRRDHLQGGVRAHELDGRIDALHAVTTVFTEE